ncbi:MAG: acetate--CoA ligase family protein [Gammaproteobacteria bacterium]|nr:acetate--CoA ligase family protein [Gammaproteobacteria bacterium]
MRQRAINLRRLLNPRHIAFVGGADAEFSARQCAALFDGPVWGVNPKRDSLGGLPCYQSVGDLPEAPDAVFLATPRSAATAIVRQLNAMGAGGVACFTAGYGELGESGQRAERELLAAAGDLALIGPNCYGFINYTNGATLWPFGSGRQRCEKGIALIMQSGMLPANLTMNDRSVPIAYVISAGNQVSLAIEDYIDALAEDPGVTAIGLYIEGIKDIKKFAAASLKALQASKPIVVLKAGRSALGSSLTVSHTGSLAGTDEAFQALFDQLGIVRVDAPVALIETLKFLSVSGAPKGRRLAAFTCSGGEATILADYCQKVGLCLPQPSAKAYKKLAELLPDIATVSNPLDYTTPLWGDRKTMPKVFKTLMDDGYDAAMVVQDFPPPHIHEDNTNYRNDANSFIDAANAVGIPAAVCSDLPENIDRESREIMIARGVTPLQGLDSGLEALALACEYGHRLRQLRQNPASASFTSIDTPAADSDSQLLDEWQGKARIKAAGIDVPDGVLCSSDEVVSAADKLGYPVVVKLVSNELPHKSDAGAVRLGLADSSSVARAVSEIKVSVAQARPDLVIDQFMVETMVEGVIGELLVGINTDPQFGQIMVIAGGGIWVELMQDSATLLLPTSRERVHAALKGLKSIALFQGYRGKPECDMDAIVETILAIAGFAEDSRHRLLEMDINPLMVSEKRVIAADVMIRETCK